MFSSRIHLKRFNTFAVQALCAEFYQPESINDLVELADCLPENFYVLGEGSNTLFLETIAPPIINPKFYGIEINSDESHYYVKVAASENWHELVLHCNKSGIFGLENLALIPGSVGAAPVQNIGAYGVEFADLCHQVDWFDFDKRQTLVLNIEQCKFKYRDSVFKNELKNKGLIIGITLKISKVWQPKLTYAGLNELSSNVSPEELLEKVICIRQSKLPDPVIVPNAGSFFKNPIISIDKLIKLKRDYEHIPFYPVDELHVKLAAGWLIEKTGLKGFEENGVGVHSKQALVLVNYGSESGQDVFTLAGKVVTTVLEKFDVQLEPEVRLISAQGERPYRELIEHG